MENSLTILVAEDSPTQAKILEKNLAGNEFNIIFTTDGQYAFEWLKENPNPDLIISDLEMPRVNGLQFCKLVKKTEQYAHIPFMLVTTLNDPNSLLKGIEAGADSYITKPYSRTAILNKVNILTSRKLSSVTKGDTAVVSIDGVDYDIKADKQHILNFFITTYQNVVMQNEELNKTKKKLNKTNTELENSKVEMEKVLKNVFPATIADYLLEYGSVIPQRYEQVTVVFTDFVNFSKSAEIMSPDDLVLRLDKYFNDFDDILEKYNLEKIKTIGDSYIFAGGLPTPNNTHAVDCVLAGLEIMNLVQRRLGQGEPWDIRIGINTGPAVAGIIGSKRFAYDLWGSAVNIASRMEQASIPGMVNISQDTFNLVKGFFYCENRGAIATKNNGELPMYFVKGLHTHLHEKENITAPNDAFHKKYSMMRRIT